MTRTQLVSLLLLVTNSMTVLAYKYVPIDYCNFDFCNQHHIACGYQGPPAKSCPPDVKFLPLGNLKNTILNMHNEKRNEIAGGTKQLKPATKMATMQWDDELSEFAFMYAFKCNLTVELCHSTDKFKHSGQNTAGMLYEDKIIPKTLDSFIVNRLERWFKEFDNATDENIAEYPESNTDPLIGHFTLAINELSTHIGCAVTSYTINEMNALTLICNYATNNIAGRRTYTPGHPAEDCVNTNDYYTNLCALDEEIDYESHIKTD